MIMDLKVAVNPDGGFGALPEVKHLLSTFLGTSV